MGLLQDLRRGWRLRARRAQMPTLFVPITRGPIENFYHFFMGFFVPLYWNRTQHPGREIAVMSVPPFNHWFDLLPAGAPKLVDQSKVAKEAVLADRRGYGQHYRVEAISYWDKWEHFGDKPLRDIATQVHRDLSKLAADVHTTTPDIVVLGRGHTPDFYAENTGKPYGASKRNIPNLSEVVEVLRGKHSVELVDGAKISPLEMFVKCHNAKLLLGQHGAGLTNIFFAQPGAAMLEIVWPEFLDNAHINIYGPLCDQLGLRWSRPTLQADAFAPVDSDQVLHEVSRLVG